MEHNNRDAVPAPAVL